LVFLDGRNDATIISVLDVTLFDDAVEGGDDEDADEDNEHAAERGDVFEWKSRPCRRPVTEWNGIALSPRQPNPPRIFAFTKASRDTEISASDFPQSIRLRRRFNPSKQLKLDDLTCKI
jgi:hypothetical protein